MRPYRVTPTRDHEAHAVIYGLSHLTDKYGIEWALLINYGRHIIYPGPEGRLKGRLITHNAVVYLLTAERTFYEVLYIIERIRGPARTVDRIRYPYKSPGYRNNAYTDIYPNYREGCGLLSLYIAEVIYTIVSYTVYARSKSQKAYG